VNPPFFSISISVRDYECDAQGILNNAVYMNYMEHARHEFLKNQLQLSFVELHTQGIDLVLRSSEIEYLAPLKSGDTCTVTLSVAMQGRLRCRFTQHIIRQGDNKIVTKAINDVVCLKNGRPSVFEPITAWISQ
jgi:acyl-CoA thioester hydrolase